MSEPVRVLYSFPHKLGAGRICYTAWEQVRGVAAAGGDVSAHPGVLHRPVPGQVRVRPTLAHGRARLPYRVLGTRRTAAVHDAIVARRLEHLAREVDIVHTWPLGGLRTLRTASRLGIPTVLERPNAHTRVAFDLVERESQRLGVPLPAGGEHVFDAAVLVREEEEYAAAYRLLCPSDFVVRTFIDQGVPSSRLTRHTYGFDPKRFFPAPPRKADGGLTAVFVGFCAVRKGLHVALEAWLASPAHHDGTFLIAGHFLPAYREKLRSLLSHRSVKVLGHRDDVPDLMRRSDIMVLPSIEEGFGLVCVEAMGSGCVPVVSDACTEVCRHLENALVHRAGDVEQLTAHFTRLREDPLLLGRLRTAALAASADNTWDRAGERLLAAYQETIVHYRS